MRPEATRRRIRLPVALELRGAGAVSVVVVDMTPAKTPVWLPRSDPGSMPASSSASQLASSSSRCWGSIAVASRGRDAEEGRVEVGRVGEEAAVAGIAGAGVVGVGVVEPLEVPAAVVGKPADRVGPPPTSSQSSAGRADATGVAAAHADDRDRLLRQRPEAGDCAGEPLRSPSA